MKTLVKSFVTASVLATIAATGAMAATYSVNQSFGTGGVSGTIETDGTIGTIGTSNVVDWSLTLTDTAGSFFLDGTTNSSVLISGSAFSATVSQLLFDFSAGSGFVLFQNPFTSSGINFWCIDNGGCINSFVPGQTVRTTGSGSQVGADFSGLVEIANSSSAPAVPLPAGLPLLGAGIAAFAVLRKKKKAA